MKIYKIAQSFNDLSEGTVIRSNFYKQEGDIILKDRYVEKGGWGDKVKYHVIFTGSGRRGSISADMITSVIKMGNV